jgi:hypothetical protein
MDKKNLMKYLPKLKVSKVKFFNNKISLVFDGEHLENRVVKKHITSLGDWSRKKKIVYYDKHLKKKDVLPILVHEVVEKYITEKYGLKVDCETHKIADAIEKNFVSKRAWLAHQQRIAKGHVHKVKCSK